MTTAAQPPALGLRHVALRLCDLARAERFFTELLGYRVAWRPDEENVYLARDGDSVALHRAEGLSEEGSGARGLLDHIGIVVERPGDVDAWAAHLAAHGGKLTAGPRTHRDGARSLYLAGPEGLVVQIICLGPESVTGAA